MTIKLRAEPKINHCSHKPLSDSFIETRDQRKRNKKTTSIHPSGGVFSRPIGWCLPLTQPETTQHLKLPVIKPIDRSINYLQTVTGSKQQLLDSITVTPEIPKNTLIYKLNHLHLLAEGNKTCSAFIWFTEKQETWNGRAESKYKNVLKSSLPRPRPPHAKNTFSSKTRKSEGEAALLFIFIRLHFVC